MGTLATIPFTGADNSVVPGFVSSGGGGFIVLSNKGFLSPSATPFVPENAVYSGIAGGAKADLDIYIEFTVPSVEFYFALQSRVGASPAGYYPNGYSINIAQENSYQLNWANPNGGPTNLAYGFFDPTPGVTWALRLRTVGATIQSKVWALGGEFQQTEPGQWDYTITDTNITAAGYASLQMVNNTSFAAAVVDNMRILDAAGIPATPPPGGFSSMMPFFGKPHPTPWREGLEKPSGDYIRNGRTFSPIVIQGFDEDAAEGLFRQAYPDMGYYNGNKDTSNNGYYDPDTVLSAHDGVMDIYMRTAMPSSGAIAGGAPATEVPLVAAVMPDNYTPITYGRAAICYKVDSLFGPGYKFVPLLWPESNDWNEGEIDFVEFDIQVGDMRTRPANAMPGTLGQGNGGNPLFEPDGIAMYAPDQATGYHVGAVEWTPDGVFFYHDGYLLAQLGPEAAPTAPMRFTIQAETWIGQGATPPEASAHVFVAWAASYYMN